MKCLFLMLFFIMSCTKHKIVCLEAEVLEVGICTHTLDSFWSGYQQGQCRVRTTKGNLTTHTPVAVGDIITYQCKVLKINQNREK